MHKIPVQIKDSQGKVKSKIIRIKAMQNRLFTGNEILQLREEKRERKQSNWSQLDLLINWILKGREKKTKSKSINKNSMFFVF